MCWKCIGDDFPKDVGLGYISRKDAIYGTARNMWLPNMHNKDLELFFWLRHIHDQVCNECPSLYWTFFRNCYSFTACVLPVWYSCNVDFPVLYYWYISPLLYRRSSLLRTYFLMHDEHTVLKLHNMMNQNCSQKVHL